MSKKTKILLIITGILAAALIGGFCVAYFVLQLPVFDRGGWYTTDGGVVQYRDYYARPLTGWQTIDSQVYHFGEDGELDTGWTDIDGQRYYFQENGAVHTGWLEEGDHRYYISSDGTPYTGWLEDAGERFYFDENGKMAANGWLELQDGTYLLDDRGNPRTGWVVVEGLRYYLYEDGTLNSNWQDTPQGLTYLKEGQRHTGWLEVPEGKFFFDKDGYSVTKWIIDNNRRCYLYEDGTLATGFVEIDGVERYFLPDGEYIVVCNRQNPVPEDYENNLVPVGEFQIDASCADALEKMFQAAKKAGYSVKINDAYRSREYQQEIWDKRKAQYIKEGMTPEEADAEVGRQVSVPGTSEHQTGLAVDIGSTKDGHLWLAEHSWEYGFILRYPDGKKEITGIEFEPWHFRYVGKTLAKKIFDSGLCLEEYIQTLKQ